MSTIESFLSNVDSKAKVFYVHNTKIEGQLSMHSHHKHQLCYVEGGVAFLNTENASYFLPARHFLWIPAGIRHLVDSRTSIKRVHNIFFPTFLFPKDHKVKQREGIYPVTNLLMEMIYYTEGWQGEVSSSDTMKYEFLQALKNIVLEVSDVPLPIALPTTSNEKLRAILKHIHHHIDQNLTLNNIANEFGYSVRSLSRLFQNNMDTSFLQYVKLTRIVKSMEMLLQTDLSVSEIAYNCGYNSLSAFSYTFQQVVKKSPLEFRKESL